MPPHDREGCVDILPDPVPLQASLLRCRGVEGKGKEQSRKKGEYGSPKMWDGLVEAGLNGEST